MFLFYCSCISFLSNCYLVFLRMTQKQPFWCQNYGAYIGSNEKFCISSIYIFLMFYSSNETEGTVNKHFFNHVKQEIFRSSHFGTKSLFYQPVCIENHRQFQRLNLHNWICSTVRLQLKGLQQNLLFQRFWIIGQLELSRSSHFGAKKLLFYGQSQAVSKIKFAHFDMLHN